MAVPCCTETVKFTHNGFHLGARPFNDRDNENRSLARVRASRRGQREDAPGRSRPAGFPSRYGSRMTTASDLESQAAAWLVRRDSGELSPEEQAEFDAWLSADPRARAAYVRLEAAWTRASGLMRRLRPLDGEVNIDLLERSPLAPLDRVSFEEYPAREGTGASLDLAATPAASAGAQHASSGREAVAGRSVRRRWALSLAAAAAVAMVAIGTVTWLAYDRNGWTEYSTDLGSLERVVLSDGSIVSLNTNSAMRVQLSPERRHIVLKRGEALFKVAKDPNRPFDVEAGRTIVRAVGTEFSVRMREPTGATGKADVEVLVKEGRVAIDPPKTQRPLERAAALPASTSTLSAGEAVVISEQRVRVQKVPVETVERKLLWTEGRIWFERETLKNVVAEFNRYNRRQMVISDPSIEDIRIGGGFDATDPESFIAALERTVNVRAFPAPQTDGSGVEVIRLVGTGDNKK
jgi:transmembrane sensor